MNFEDEIILEHFEIPENFEIYLHVSCNRDSVKVVCTNKETKDSNYIYATVDKFASKMGVVVDALIDAIKEAIEIR